MHFFHLCKKVYHTQESMSSAFWDSPPYRTIKEGGLGFLMNLMRVNLGIGTTNPSQKLDVSGNIRLTGRISQGSLGDLAEMMPVSTCILNPVNLALEPPEFLAKGMKDNVPLIFKNQKEYAKYLLGKPEAGDVVVVEVLAMLK